MPWDIEAMPELWSSPEDAVAMLQSAGIEVTDEADPTAAVLAAAAEIERATRREFGATTEARYLNGSGTALLRLPGAVRSVSLAQTADASGAALSTIPSADYYLWPEREARKIRLRRRIGTWPKGIRNLKVMGVWGEEPTEDLRRAHLCLSAAILADPAVLARTGGVKRYVIEQDSVETETDLSSGMARRWATQAARVILAVALD